MGGFLGIGGSASKTNRKYALGGFQGLQNLFNFALPTGENLFSEGSSTLSQPLAYWQNLLSGNRSSMLAATAPENNAALSSEDAARRQLAATGTARGGGIAGQNVQAGDQTRAAIQNNLFKQRGEAAKNVAQIGETQLSDAINQLGLGESTASSLTGNANTAGQQSDANAAAAGQAAGKLAATLAGLFF